jgi:hypothetical protein
VGSYGDKGVFAVSISLALLPVALAASLIPSEAVAVSAIMLLYVGFFVTTLVDAFWIFKGEKINRLVDVFAKTDVLNESQNKL